MKFKRQFAQLSIASALIASTLGAGQVASASSAGEGPGQQAAMYGDTSHPKNVIFLVGDGMGPAYNTAYRYFADNPDTKEIERTAFDDYLVGTQQTHSDDEKENITDSAAAGTAISTGYKTYNGAIGVDKQQNDLETVLERAKKIGKSTGLVSTAEITDATPAAYAANVDDRDKKDEIAQQFYNQRIQNQHKVDVILGGGAKYFGKENGNITEQFKNDGYGVVTNRQQLENAKEDQLLGLFADKNMPLEIDADDDQPELADMQNAALDRLSKNDKGFFLMVEGASIDKQGHSNDVTGVMSEMEAFEKAFANAIDYAKANPDTLVVATADHSTGGLSMGEGGIYEWNPVPIQQMKHSGKWMTEQIADGKGVEETIRAGYGFDLTSKEIKAIQQEADQLKQLDEESDDYEKQQQKLADAIQAPINKKSNTGWTTTGHTGVDANTYAFGPGADQFQGNIDNTDNAKNIFNFFGDVKQ
ncbi:alkaline phosphatase [Staphylococcus delphini]|uniref:alkaline phosphatase n=1 Tax=Staphylococcus delphini TaxID=53344 RepID=UPI000BBB9439|nr:alkaline phosphatase [Staphylococcus delphini]PCF60823.1 alkaline phosphatase [Staphylococcus delphini]PCF72263.1 alkaline phosphatase [Staphylococcus delphini]